MNGNKRHLILIGLMGCGKSTVGRLLAQELGMPFADLDEVIEERQGCTVREIFRNSGEEAFREMEAEMLRELLSASPMVLATGGGAVLRKENREQMKKSGLVIHLHAEPEELVSRLRSESDKRPLLAGSGDLLSCLKKIIAVRAGMYEFADWKVDTTGRTACEVAREIAAGWRVRV
jgi:shikimate kinase